MGEAKSIDVECPCCRSRLHIDVLTRSVLRAASPAQVDEMGKPVVAPRDWDRALGKVKERRAEGERSFDGALERERRRAEDLEDLFRRAAAKAAENPPAADESDGATG